MKPLVYIIILTYNGKENLEYCLPSVMKTDYPNFKIVVIDNASKDGSSEFVRKNYPSVKLIRNEKNLYYSGGNNIGINYAITNEADYIVILNDDIIVDKRWLKYAVSVAEKDKRIGFIEFDLMDPVKKGNMTYFENAKKEFKTLKTEPIEYITGCSMFVRVELFNNIGMFDEVFLIYAEETDLVRRAKKASYKLIKINIPVFHKGGATMSKMKFKSAYLMMRNLLRLCIKNDSLFGILKMSAFVLNSAVNPFKKVDEDTMVGRLRPYNPIINLFILTIAVGWNIVFLPQTIFIKYKDLHKINKMIK